MVAKKSFREVRSLANFAPTPLTSPSVCIWGANTGVGKTLVSAGLAVACQRAARELLYLKPLQTGFPGDSDARFVGQAVQQRDVLGAHAASVLEQPGGKDTVSTKSNSNELQLNPKQHGIWLKTLFAWRSAVSPHLAVEMEGA